MALVRKDPLPFSANPALQFSQDSLRKLQTALSVIPFLDGVLLEDLAVTTTATDFAHGLNRTFRGFIVLKVKDNSVIRNPAASTNDAKFIRLQTGTNTTATLWVF